MKPLPSSDMTGKDAPLRGAILPSLSLGDPIPSNQRRSANPVRNVYPWLLLASTTIATVFCILYITKPVIETTAVLPAKSENPLLPKSSPLAAADPEKAPKPTSPSAHGEGLPGHQDGAPAAKTTAALPKFEETNLGIQHVLTAQAPAGDLCRIVLDVPVLYQSRQLRWTEKDVEEARGLLMRLSNYQEKTIALRAEGLELLDEWNRLLNRSIPASELRADSPALPANQKDSPVLIVPAGLDTRESIQLKPSEK